MDFLVFFIAGLIFGSFLNSVIYRLKNGYRLGGRSFCPKCKTNIKWFDLVPVLSFICLFGRCRYCRKVISWQYPTVELLSGLIWVFTAYKLNFRFFSLYTWQNQNFYAVQSIINFQLWSYFYYVFIFSVLLIIAVYDFKWKIIPNTVIYPAIIVAFIFDALSSFRAGDFGILMMHIIIASGAFLFFFLIYFFSDGYAMGLGDAKLALLISLFLKPVIAIAAFNIAFIIGAICGIILLVIRCKTLKSQIAFAPFLAIGTIIAFFLSDFINNFIIF